MNNFDFPAQFSENSTLFFMSNLNTPNLLDTFYRDLFDDFPEDTDAMLQLTVLINSKVQSVKRVRLYHPCRPLRIQR